MAGIRSPDGGGPWLPFGISGIFKSLPFAIWFYLAIEEVPLAAEESMDPKRDVPKGTIWGMHTLLIVSLLTLFLNTGIGGGPRPIGASGTPLFDGFKAIFGDGTAAELLGLIGLLGSDRELLHDHLRVRSQHVLALPCRILPRVPVEDRRNAEDAARGPDRRGDRRLLRGLAGVVPGTQGRRRGTDRSSRRC